jgi:hypothetical protein
VQVKLVKRQAKPKKVDLGTVDSQNLALPHRFLIVWDVISLNIGSLSPLHHLGSLFSPSISAHGLHEDEIILSW